LGGFQALVTLTLTLDRVTRHTIEHHLLSSIYISNFTEIGKTLLWEGHPKFKVTWHKNWEKYHKSGRNKFRYCALV